MVGSLFESVYFLFFSKYYSREPLLQNYSAGCCLFCSFSRLFAGPQEGLKISTFWAESAPPPWLRQGKMICQYLGELCPPPSVLCPLDSYTSQQQCSVKIQPNPQIKPCKGNSGLFFLSSFGEQVYIMANHGITCLLQNNADCKYSAVLNYPHQ